jgi:hypothetical protein
MSKYEPLKKYLLTLSKDVGETQLTFDQIEKILGSPLPTARYYLAWWANEKKLNMPQRCGWRMRAGGSTRVCLRYAGSVPARQHAWLRAYIERS